MAIPTNEEIWADFNLDGSVKEPFKQDIRRKMNFIEALAAAAGVGAKPYSTKAAMDADLSQPDGKIGLVYADPVDTNNFPTLFYWNDAGNVWVMGTDRVGRMQNQVSGNSGAIDGLFAATGAPRPTVFAETSSYLQTWVTIGTPSTRFTITPSAAGYQVVGLAGLPTTAWPVGIKEPFDFVPGNSLYFEAMYTGGTLDAQAAFWIGTDTATTGDISTNARMTAYRNNLLQPVLSNGISSDSGRALTPGWSGVTATPLVVGVVYGFAVDVLSDRSVRFRITKDGVQ